MNINDYKDYEVGDFVEDEHFRKWVLEQGLSLDFFWQAYVKKYPKQSDKMDEAKQLILDTHNFFHQKAAVLSIPDDGFSSRLKTEMGTKETKQLPVKKKARRRLIYQLAAACILFIGGFFYYLQFESNNRIEYLTSNAEWKVITLPDGSQVELNANSQLALIEGWENGTDRMVWLKGEAFFKVEKKPSTNAKFIVVTKDLKVEVLGTSFNVNTRNQHTEVFLEEGKITLELDKHKEQIEPGEFIAYSQEKKQVTNRYKKTEEIHSNWKNGVLEINDATMKKILNEFEFIYGVDLIVNDKKLLEREGSIAIPVDNLDLATAILERVLNVKIEKRGKQIFIN